MVLNPVQLQLYLVHLSHLPYLVAFYVLVRLYVLSQLYPQSYLICICFF
jgi:hypothetical protein